MECTFLNLNNIGVSEYAAQGGSNVVPYSQTIDNIVGGQVGEPGGIVHSKLYQTSDSMIRPKVNLEQLV